MIKEGSGCTDTAMPSDSPWELCPEGSDGLSVSTSECSSQSNSRNNRCRTPDSASMPTSECSDLVSWMPIIDEEDRQARSLWYGRAVAENDNPAQRAVCNLAYRKSAYQLQVRRWQDEETGYLRHEDWCEFRVIILMQEAFRCSIRNLRRVLNSGAMSLEVYTGRVSELKTSLLHIKKEYRRTLQRMRARQSDLSSIASKAVTCIASVFPWSCSGFVMGFEENIQFGRLLDKMGSGSRRGTPIAMPTQQQQTNVSVTCRGDARAERVVLSGRRQESADALVLHSHGIVSSFTRRRLGTTRVTSTSRPPRCQLFPKQAPGEKTPPRSSVSIDALADTAPISPGPPPSGTLNRSFFAFSPHNLSPKLPAQVHLPPVSVAGPFRNDERRFLEKGQIILQGMAFVSRSLASSIFISSRRATIATATMRERLILTQEQAQPPTVHPGPEASAVKLRHCFPSFSAKSVSHSKMSSMMPGNVSLGDGAMSSGLHSGQVVRCPSPLVLVDSGSLSLNGLLCASGASSPPSYTHAAAVTDESILLHPAKLPVYYPSRIRRDRWCIDPINTHSPPPSMPPVSLEEERYVKELW